MNKKDSLVSVITVTYNAVDELEETIESIINQSYSNIEFLVIDGGSTDGTLDILNRYKDKIDFILSEPDEGIYDAMNKGIKNANGEWLNFMNAGDSFASLNVIKQLEDKLHDQTIDIIGGNRYLMNNGEKTLQKAKGIVDFWTKGSPCFHQSMIIRKEAIADKGYNMCYKLSSDYEFMVRSVTEGKVFSFVDFPISNFLEGGASKQHVIRSQVEAIKVLLDHTNDENIIKNNIFFQGLIRQNSSEIVKNTPSAKQVAQSNKQISVKPLIVNEIKREGQIDKKILIVDPIFRASRLFYSWLVASKLSKENCHVDILSRSFAMTEQYYEYFNDIPHTLYDGINVAEDFWFGILTKKNVQEMLQKLRYLEHENKYDYIYFAGLNEQYPNLFEYMNNNVVEELVDKKMLFIEYDVRHLVKDKVYFKFNNLISSVRTTLTSKKYSFNRKNLVFTFLKKYNNTKIGILDERINSRKLSKIIKNKLYKHFFYLPDPSPKIIYKPQAITTDKVKVLLVGLQNRRKGIDQLIKYLKSFDEKNKIEFTFVGRLSEETEKYRDFLKENRHVQWHEGYFPEEEIQRFYSGTDYIFLPYTPDFTASSGVLAYGTSFDKPIVSTNHGLIGYKVKHYSLGYTYKYNSINQLSKVFSNLASRGSAEYKHMSKHSIEYSQQHSIEEHQNIITKVLNND